MSLRPAQLPLRLGAGEVPASLRWQDGDRLPFLGATLTLRLDTHAESAERQGDELHLPLPPHARPRQVQDACEAWLQREAVRYFEALVHQRCQSAGLAAPVVQLSFAARGKWVELDAPRPARPAMRPAAVRLKCHWRLIEQAPEAIEQALAHALAALQARHATPDLFGPGVFSA